MRSESNVRDLVISGISTKFPDRHLGKSPNELSTNEQNQSNGCFFDPHCPECIRDLWGPLLSPFAYLIKQNAQYFNEILMQIGQYKTNTTTNSSPSQRAPKPPKLQYDDHKFLTGIGMCAFRSEKIGWLITLILGLFLLILSIAMIALKSSSLPSLIAILRMNEASVGGMKFTLQMVFIILSLIGTGKILASILGLFGTAYRTQSIMLGTLILIIILILFEIGLVIYCIISWSELISGAENALDDSFQTHYGSVDNDELTNAWDQLFQTYECCGWLENDFTNTPWGASAVHDMPESCCRPDASHPACQSTTSSTDENYADTDCQSAIRVKITSSAYVIIAIVIVAIIILIEVASAILTYLYLSSLKTAGRRRRQRNAKLMSQYKKRLASYTQESSDEVDNKGPDRKQIPPRDDQVEVDDLRQLYNQYSAFHRTPPDIDPSLMSITPTVIQVKRPNIYSYFYYE